MLRSICKSKIHMAAVTEKKLEYIGSITIDGELMEAADILPNEEVHILNVTNGARFETYAIEGKPGTGVICVNGAAARCSEVGDKVIIIAYGLMDESLARSYRPKIVFVDEKNRKRQ